MVPPELANVPLLPTKPRGWAADHTLELQASARSRITPGYVLLTPPAFGVKQRYWYGCTRAQAAVPFGSGDMGGSQLEPVGAPSRTVYCATKHAIEGMTKALACEVGPHGIRVNSVCPTFISTDMTRAQLARPEFREQVLGKIALGRLGELSDVMGPIVFLASDAAALITGASLLVDGGWTAA